VSVQAYRRLLVSISPDGKDRDVGRCKGKMNVPVRRAAEFPTTETIEECRAEVCRMPCLPYNRERFVYVGLAWLQHGELSLPT
jgi:hypothetical protein